MKLGQLINVYNELVDALNLDWDELIINMSNGETAKLPEDNYTYATPLTKGELMLSKIAQKYENLENILFYISDTKNRVKIPELGVSIACAEDQLGVLQHKLFNYSQLNQAIGELGFKVVDINAKNGNLGITQESLNRGFDLIAMEATVDFLEKEISRYEKYMNKALWSVEVVFPQPEDSKVSVLNIPAREGSLKKQVTPNPTVNNEVDMSEYKSADDYIKNPEPAVPKKKVEAAVKQASIPVHPNCAICNNPNREFIELLYNETQGDSLQTLQFASSECNLPTLTPNQLLMHLERHHIPVASEYVTEGEVYYNDPDKHKGYDHAYLAAAHPRQKPIQNKTKMKNLAPGAFNPDEHIGMEHAI